MQNSLIQLSDELAAAVERAAPSVVAVYAGGRPTSGVHWSDGAIVTAEHSLRRDDEIQVGLDNGRLLPAALAGRDAGSDLAVLKIPAGSLPVISKGAAVKPGNLILAVGRHREIGVCAAMGIASVVGPGWNTWRGGRVDSFVRLDISLYAGASGAAVVNARGEAVGIATPVLSRIAPVAIPLETVDRIASELIRRGRVARAYLGVGLQPVPLPAELGGGGLIVLSVEADSPAARAGFVVGDIVTTLDGRSVRDTRDVQSILTSANIGKPVPAGIVRGGQRAELTLTVGEK